MQGFEGHGVQGFEFRASGSRFSVSGLGFHISGLGLWVIIHFLFMPLTYKP